MAENTSFIMGIAGIGVAFIVALMGWMPYYIIFGVIIFAGVLYDTKFFATGIIGAFASGVFASFGWIPAFAYFTAIVMATVFLATKIAGKYFNIGGTQT